MVRSLWTNISHKILFVYLKNKLFQSLCLHVFVPLGRNARSSKAKKKKIKLLNFVILVGNAH